jgi:hypothetical protein
LALGDDDCLLVIRCLGLQRVSRCFRGENSFEELTTSAPVTVS